MADPAGVVNLHFDTISLIVEFLGEPDSTDEERQIRERFQQLHHVSHVNLYLANWYSWWRQTVMDIMFC